MKLSPEELEKLIHGTLRSLPDRRAPRSLEASVFASIAARAALPWWKKSFVEWPMGARVLFVLLSGVALFALVWGSTGFEANQAAQITSAVAPRLAWLSACKAALMALVEFGSVVIRNIPTLWLYGGLAGLAALYLTLFGLGATAYRTLYANR